MLFIDIIILIRVLYCDNTILQQALTHTIANSPAHTLIHTLVQTLTNIPKPYSQPNTILYHSTYPNKVLPQYSVAAICSAFTFDFKGNTQINNLLEI